MKSYVLLLALLQAVRCSGVPLYDSELGAMADRGLTAALARVNSVYAVSHLYRATRGSVTKVIPMGLNTVDLQMVFGIKETQCVKASRHDPQTCAFRPGFFVPTFSCSSRLRVSANSTQVVSLKCGRDSSSSSSSESSEEAVVKELRTLGNLCSYMAKELAQRAHTCTSRLSCLREPPVGRRIKKVEGRVFTWLPRR
ncbi:hypothetical protein JOQ06_000616 [Pogonophryne albipinna]|uniref:Secreted phosphoprotein 24 n=1 Tax=Pogonophryne albipinna TaxID=1090488 RepID=A0AAD6AGQ2_9TELE|nr:hypothetical protein JOQ06_000616 [Pogonophryne albipinna]